MYLDHNATSPMPERVRTAVTDAMANAWANPSSPHALGQAAAAQVQRCRNVIAERLEVRPKDVFFTSGATEANAWVLGGSDIPVVAASTEHPSVLEWSQETVPVSTTGLVDLDVLAKRLRTGRALVSVMAANNETGVRQPVDEIGQLCRQHGATFHCDATQVFGRMDDVFEADFVTVSAHKFGGPRGVGALVTRTPPPGLLRGGQQERGHRAGTLNVPGIIGFAEALQCERHWNATERDKLEVFCLEQGALVVGSGTERLPNTLSVLFKHPGDLLVAALDLQGVFASTGSACSSGSSQRSHVLDAMGLDGTPVRFSFGPESKAQPAIDALVKVLEQLEGACV